MNSELSSLVELQKVDAEIASLKSEIAALPKKVQAIDAKLAKARKRVDDAKAAIKANELSRRNFEHEIQGENTKIIKFREQSSSVKTNEQYKALLSEIAQAETQIRNLEDKILDSMVELDAHHDEVKRAEADLKSDSAVIEKEKAEAAARTKETETLLADRQARRKDLRSQISESMLNHYDRVARSRSSAMAEARGQRCQACMVMLRPQVWEEVRNGTVVHTCDTCGRILYYDAASAAVAEPIAANAPTVEREWLFIPTMGANGAFVVLVNAKGNASMRAFDALSGVATEKHTEKNTTYQHAFAELLHTGRNIFVDEPGVEERNKEQLPPEFVAELRHQLPNDVLAGRSSQ